ncbi:Guanylate-binding protein 3 [Geodia barretti]|uniref:Guanylate-binding protein 3 n=1 Tax=Geodia barretti TaxID=519541 RepID=A0AA35R0V9_GEOBA|nr:Guanylate-binding protein 3 [Geodia barretti]
MRCFSQLSASLLAQCGESMSMDAKKAFFPHFLWLLRDVSLKMTDREGKELAPTKFLHTRVLASESGELTDLGKSLVSLFPSLECATLPIPSIKRNIIRGILEQRDKLKPAFNAAVDTLIQQVLQKVAPKKAVDGTTTVTGKALAALAAGYVEAVNRPGALPDLDQGWQAVVRLELNEVSYKLVREYEREMEEALEGKLPMEERHLLEIHQQTLKKGKECLRQDIYHVNPLHSSDEESQPLLDQLEDEIVQWSESKEDGEGKVSGGLLYRFTTQNFKKSKEHCATLLNELVKNSKVQEKVNLAMRNSDPVDITREVSEIAAEYQARAVGPAAGEILETGISELNQLSDILKKIPGQVSRVTLKTGRNSVKLYWGPPKKNPEAVEEYVVYKRVEGGEWEEAGRTDKTKLLLLSVKVFFWVPQPLYFCP